VEPGIAVFQISQPWKQVVVDEVMCLIMQMLAHQGIVVLQNASPCIHISWRGAGAISTHVRARVVPDFQISNVMAFGYMHDNQVR
jgi:hypothetical protein